MPSINPLPASDPISQAVLRSGLYRGHHPVPLISTSYDISICGGLADVVAKRTFRNSEATTIEATLTFPLPIHAVLYSLEAKVGTRTVKAVAKSKSAAREKYEDAIDRGKTAVLHEELFRGVHMLSVGNVAPGADIEVTARFAIVLSWMGGKALLRIPTTVGDIYGNSGLPDCDEIVHGGPVIAADVTVRSDTGTPMLRAAPLVDGTARVALDAPIVIEVKDWTSRELCGRAADGSPVALSIAPAATSEANLDAAILVDHSGSMEETCAVSARLSKHATVLLGLNEASGDLTESDRLNLWEFDNVANDLGTAHASTWRSLIHLLSPPNGGTEIGMAIDTLLAQRPVRDVLLITDGKSHAIDVQQLAASGVRFTLVLIGDDSLEANVGHLAALTGGEIFVPEGAAVAAAVRGALRSMRSPLSRERAADPAVNRACASRSGMSVVATWGTVAARAGSCEAMARAVGAYVASLRMLGEAETVAAQIAESEGLVTHLTSLVLVDEEGASQQGLPATRKVALPSPGTYQPVAASRPKLQLSRSDGGRGRVAYCMAMPYRGGGSYGGSSGGSVSRSAAPRDEHSLRQAPAPGALEASTPVEAQLEVQPVPTQVRSLSHIVRRIDWRAEGQRLAEGNMIGLSSEVADAIDAAATYGAVKRVAKRLGIPARLLVIGLLARVRAGDDRHAERVSRAILAKAKSRDFADVAEKLGLGIRAGVRQ